MTARLWQQCRRHLDFCHTPYAKKLAYRCICSYIDRQEHMLLISEGLQP
jgi:hypothetical protein